MTDHSARTSAPPRLRVEPKSPDQLAQSIDLFRRAFWARQSTPRPPIGIVPDAAWQPISYLRAPLAESEIALAQITRALYRTDYEHAFASRAVLTDDFLPYSAAWRAVPWLEAICGCPVRTAAGSLAPAHIIHSPGQWRDAPIPAAPAWLDRLRTLTADLSATAPDDCWISPSIFRGVTDVLGAMRGLNDFFLDLHDSPELLAETAARINRLHLDVLDLHFSHVRPKLGGYGHIFGYWAPAPTTVIQEDALGMCGPAIYQRHFMQHSAEIVRHLGDCVFFHLHSTGYRHYRHVLDIPDIAGIELTVETNGPALLDMLPDLRAILERSRLILMIDGWYEQLLPALRQLPREGLYLLVSDKFIPDETAFRAFSHAAF
jgi:hypothetical protein